ncbi:MAG: penicillin-binding protein 2 [Wenzhouxiangella sp.]|nr:MAG: penicillin-binding protein 2 [Wenzhouxiangella sp.]
MKPTSTPVQGVIRLWVTAGVMMVAALAVLGQAIKLQIMETEFLQGQGEARFLRQVAIPTVRGNIVDRNGEPLAVSTPVDSVWAHPGELLQAADRIPMLAAALETSAEEMERRLTQRSGREFVWLQRRIHPETADRIRAMEIPGVFMRREYRRFYPTGEVSAQVLGFTNIDDIGQEGLELAYNSWLQGDPGAKRVIKDRLGRTVQNVELIREARPGRDLVLTIDRRLQYLAFRELKAGVLEFEARSGSVVIMDIPTGEVLAMVNFPSYNPNSPSRIAAEGLRNRALTDVIEPGSVIKPFALAAAMESGQVYTDMMIDTSPGHRVVAGHTIRDIRNFGEMGITEMLARSSNVGMVDLVLNMDARHLWGVYSRFGFGSVSGSGFPGESAGVLRDYERWRRLEQATLAYGYGLSVTPVQLVRAMAAIADEGRLRQPVFVKGADNPPQSVLDPAVARELATMLEAATVGVGTGTRAQVAGYRVAGKTGTTRKVGAGGYSERYVASFAGFAPASRPRLAAVVVINDPTGEAYYGGQVAAPVFGRVMDAALRLLAVPPDQFDTLMTRTEVRP